MTINNEKKMLIEKLISETKEIVDKYYTFGVVNREEIIRNIKYIGRNSNLTEEWDTLELTACSVPIERATDEQLIIELKKQLVLLKRELLYGD